MLRVCVQAERGEAEVYVKEVAILDDLVVGWTGSCVDAWPDDRDAWMEPGGIIKGLELFAEPPFDVLATSACIKTWREQYQRRKVQLVPPLSFFQA